MKNRKEGKGRKEGKEKGKGIVDFLLIAFFFAGVLILLYPNFSNIWNQYRSNLLMTEYEDGVARLSSDEREQIWKAAQEYNASHTTNVVADAFTEETDVLNQEYEKLLNPEGNGIMGSIMIPSIDVNLPIYHGTGEEELKRGCGHLQGTSLPIGGSGTHAVLAAHRGLPSAILFTDLDRLECKDIFYLTIMDKKLAYEIDQIKTVLPEKTEELDIVDGEDCITLITCTPYGVNTHRLLVRGHRIPYEEADGLEHEERIRTGLLRQAVILLIILLIAILVIVGICSKTRSRRKRKIRRKRNVR